jgi:hypothetical protein
MTGKRFAATVAAAFLVAQICAIAIHGFILASDYAPFYGVLLRPMSTEGSPAMLLLPLSHLSFIIGLVWVYGRLALDGSALSRGVTIGIIGYLMGQAPLWMLWYAESPWPGSLVVKQLALELIASLAIGLTVAAVARVERPARAMGVASAR